MADQTPAGWYADPMAPGQNRWWDGSQWTQDVQRQQAQPPPPQSQTTVLPTYENELSEYRGYATSPSASARQWWKRKRVLIPTGLLALAGIGGALTPDAEQTPAVRADTIQEVGELDPAGDSGPEPDQSTTSQTAAPTTVAPTTVAPTTVAPTTVAPTTVAPTTVAPTTAAPTTAAPTTVAPTTAAPTTVAPTTAAPTTVAPTTVAPTTAAPTTLENYVTPGAFCSPEGATGKTSTGKNMVCSSTKKDGTPYGEGKSRWRSP